MSKIFFPMDIDNLETTVMNRRFHQSAQACTVLRMLASCVGFDHTDIESKIDDWAGYILNLEHDLSSDDLGSIFRLAARFCDQRADNYRDEHATTEVYR